MSNQVDTNIDIDKETDRPFFIIFSNRTLNNISELITKYQENCANENENLDNFSLIVPDKFNGNATNRTIVVMDELLFDALKKDEHSIDNFNIQRLQYRKHFYPNKTKNEVYNLYINLPKNLTLSECQVHLMERMTCLRTIGLWDKMNYTIVYPKMNRLEDKHAGFAYIYFKEIKEEKQNDVALTRIFINNTKWPGTTQDVSCMWVRKNLNTEKGLPSQTTDTIKTGTVWDEKGGNHK